MVLLDSLDDSSSGIKRSPMPRKRSWLFNTLVNLSSIIFFSAVVFAFINFPAFLMISKYKISPKSVSTDYLQLSQAKEPSEVTQFQDNTIFISRIGVKAPIIWDVGSGEVMDQLQNGVVHIGGSGYPGENKNIFLTGHSSNYWWRGGDYNNVFALLPQLEIGDEILVTYHGKLEKFAVSEKKEIKKQEAGDYVVADERRLTLMTCVPIGTNLRRLVIIAK